MHPAFHAILAQTVAQAGDAAGQQGGLLASPLVPLLLIAPIFYFLFFRPQQKQAKEHQAFLSALAKGTEVVTQGGIIGTVVLVEDRTVTLDVGGGNKVRILKSNVVGAWQEKPAASAKPEKK